MENPNLVFVLHISFNPWKVTPLTKPWSRHILRVIEIELMEIDGIINWEEANMQASKLPLFWVQHARNN